MKLSDVISGHMGPDPEISDLVLDSRQVQPGVVFAALKGTQVDGRTFIPQALSNGAVAILTHADTPKPEGCEAAWLAVEDPASLLAQIAAQFYAPQPQHLMCITGTNGKTSVADLLRQLCLACGDEAASVGTLGVCTANTRQDLGMTSPDAITLHKALQSLAKSGVTHVALEASSHGLDQRRLDGVVPSVVAFTNLTQDHLDYHGSMAAYAQAKLRLFDRLATPTTKAVIWKDAPGADLFLDHAELNGLPVITCGHGSDVSVRLLNRQAHETGQALAFEVNGEPFAAELPLVGAFQAHNALLALAMAHSLDMPTAELVRALESLQPIPGRMQRVGRSAVYVDYAHTPDGLETALQAISEHARGVVHVVLGCGGDRDRDKRAKMGAIAQRLADHVIVTDDNPRREDPASIRAAILTGCPKATEIADRRAAIHQAMQNLGDGDVLLIAGKGHEQGQILADRTVPFDDVKVAQEALEAVDV